MKEFKISLRLTVRTINTVFPVLRENSLKLLVKKKKKYIYIYLCGICGLLLANVKKVLWSVHYCMDSSMMSTLKFYNSNKKINLYYKDNRLVYEGIYVNIEA